MLQSYSGNGYRVIALAGKELEPSLNLLNVSKLPRDTIEQELDFYGLLVMQNKLKPETTSIITELNNAGLRSVMVTGKILTSIPYYSKKFNVWLFLLILKGDNLFTALNVARKCGIIPAQNKVIVVDAHPPTEYNIDLGDVVIESSLPKIEWKLAESFNDENAESQTNDQVNFILFSLML